MRILSGIQPSGKLHLGNYFGMMKPVIDYQLKDEPFVFIADYHALTTVHDPDAMRRATMDVAMDFLACGLDPEKTVFYKQSDVPEVAELTWFLSVVTPMGLLERCHSFKDKTTKGILASHGLFSYPVLMAADILAVQSEVVPVGRDQKQHVEVARDIAGKFNRIFGDVFRIPEPDIRDNVAVVPGVDGQKMSKSYNNTIEIFGSESETKKRVMRIVTDSKTVDDPKNPEECNLFALYKLLASEDERNSLALKYKDGGIGYGDVKKALFSKIWEGFEPFRNKRAGLEKDPGAVHDVLQKGAEKARKVISATLSSVRRAAGISV